MLCENCKKNNASFHYRHNENGKITEVHLCSRCAQKSNMLNDASFDKESFFGKGGLFNDLIGINPYVSMFSDGGINSGVIAKSKICPSCGMSEYELRKCGKIGCKECYSVFDSTINAMLKKLHISTQYKGKVPDGISENLSVLRKLEKLKSDLQNAVSAQEYEEAAKLRDAIKQLENASNNEAERNDG